MILALIVAIGFLIRLWQLDSLPGEIWGDVIEHYKLVLGIYSGQFAGWWGSDGPLFPYLVYSLSRLNGLSFYTFKLTTALLGTVVILTQYMMVKAVTKKKSTALIAAFLMSVTFAFLSFSRQAKANILAPLFATLAVYFLANKKPVKAGLGIGLGIFSQASFWGAIVFAMYHWKTALIASIFVIVLFITQQGKLVSPTSYVGEKFFGTELTASEYVARFGTNISRNVLALGVKGDPSFRHTIPGQPHLDYLSAFFFWFGMGLAIIWIIKKRDFRWWWYGIFPLLFLQIPSLMDVMNPNSSPNMGRTLVLLPFALLLAATAIDWLSRKITGRGKWVFLTIALGWVCFSNLKHYFVDYPLVLPNKNVAFSPIIVSVLDNEYPGLPIRMVHCCWGENGQPEPMAIFFELGQKRDFKEVSVDEVVNHPQSVRPSQDSFLLLVEPHNDVLHQHIKNIYLISKERIVIHQGVVITRIYLVR